MADTCLSVSQRLNESRISLHPLLRDLVLTAGAELCVLLASLVIISVLGRLYSAVALGEYLLLRRVLAWLQSGSQLGFGVALPRYVADAVEGSNRDRQSYLLVASLSVLGVSIALGLVMISARHLVAKLMFGNPAAVHLIVPLSLLLTGLAAHTCTYGYYRGLLAMGRANALQLWNLAVVPLLSLVGLRHTGSIALLISTMGAITLVSSLIVAAVILACFLRSHPDSLWCRAWRLLVYGLPRVPGDFALTGLLALGPIMASHVVAVGQVAYLLLGLSILSAVGAGATPIGTLMLSKVAMMLAQRRHGEIRLYLEHTCSAVVEISVFGCLQIAIFTDAILRLWVGRGFDASLTVTRIIVLAIPFYMAYATLRGSIDAASTTPYNAYNICGALGTFVLLACGSIILLPVQFVLSGIAMALLLAFALLAWLTLRTARHLLNARLSWRRSRAGFAAAVLLAVLSLASRQLWGQGLPTMALALSVSSILFLVVLKSVETPWLPFLLRLTFATNLPYSETTARPLQTR